MASVLRKRPRNDVAKVPGFHFILEENIKHKLWNEGAVRSIPGEQGGDDVSDWSKTSRNQEEPVDLEGHITRAEENS